jgi:broad specificity phosphatase PhoE
MNKVLYFIRHGTALHNILFLTQGNSAYLKYRDTPLVARGMEESNKLGENWKGIHKIELVIVSPLLRTLQTTENIFRKTNIPIIGLDCVMEYPQGLEKCNHRKSIIEYKPCYPKVDFSYIEDDIDNKWRPDRYETVEELNKRIKKLKRFINTRNEKHIAIVSHSSFISQFLYNKIGDETNELFHCHPYVYEL